MTDELKPCPFHERFFEHRSPQVYINKLKGAENWHAECSECGAEGSLKQSEAEAISAWNTRSPDPRLSVAVEALEDVTAIAREYRENTPLGHQPHMIAHRADKSIAAAVNALSALSDVPVGVKPLEWQLEAFDKTLALAAERDMAASGDGLSLAHIQDMRARITPDFSRGKLGRWLGWAQCAVVASGIASLDEMKEINRLAAHPPAPTGEQS